MKIRRWLSIVSLSLVSVFLFPVQAWACACCSDEGEDGISFRKPSAHELELMREMRFGPMANTIQTAADNPPGIADRYSLTAALSGNLWKLSLRAIVQNQIRPKRVIAVHVPPAEAAQVAEQSQTGISGRSHV